MGLAASVNYSYTGRLRCGRKLPAQSATIRDHASRTRHAKPRPSGLTRSAEQFASQVGLTASADNVGVAGLQNLQQRRAGCYSRQRKQRDQSHRSSNDLSLHGRACDGRYCFRPRVQQRRSPPRYRQIPRHRRAHWSDGNANQQSAINLAWTAATDNVGVDGLQGLSRRQFAGQRLGNVTSYSDAGSRSASAYSYIGAGLRCFGQLFCAERCRRDDHTRAVGYCLKFLFQAGTFLAIA